jgi:hypothetical protein
MTNGKHDEGGAGRGSFPCVGPDEEAFRGHRRHGVPQHHSKRCIVAKRSSCAGFGSFRLRKREPRKGRNPKTGDKVDVPPKKVPYFKPGKELKELINKEAPAPAAGSPAGDASLPPDALAV